MKKLIHDRTCVHNLGYHIVWSTKYRKEVLVDCIANDTKEILNTISKEKGFSIKIMEIMPDHVHVFVQASPKLSPSYIAKMLKGISARRLLIRHGDSLKNQLWNNHLWNPSYYIESVGHISEDVIKKYIAEQKIRC